MLNSNQAFPPLNNFSKVRNFGIGLEREMISQLPSAFQSEAEACDAVVAANNPIQMKRSERFGVFSRVSGANVISRYWFGSSESNLRGDAPAG